MTRQLLDRTLRTAPTPDPRLWRTFGGGTTDVREAGGVLDFTPVVSYGRHVLDRLNTVQTDQGILLLVARSGSGTSRLRIWLSHDGTTSGSATEFATNGLSCSVTNTGDLSIAKVVGGTATSLATAITGKVPAGGGWVRFERTAGLIRARSWAVNATEPTTWDFSVTDDTGIAAGRAGFSYYRSGTTQTVFTVAKPQIYTPAGGIPAPNRPRLYTRPGAGSRIGYGRQATVREDNATEANPSWLTGTTTLDAVNGLRTLQAAAGATANLTGPAAAADAHVLTVHNLRLGADVETNVALRFTDGTNTVELRQDAADNQCRLVVNGTSYTIVYRISRNGEGPRHRTLTLLVAPRVGQAIALTGDWRNGSVLGWADVPAGMSRTASITPSVQVASTGSNPASVAWTGLTVETQRL